MRNVENQPVLETEGTLASPQEVRDAMRDLGLDVPEAEKADMSNSPVTKEEMRASMEALREPAFKPEKLTEIIPAKEGANIDVEKSDTVKKEMAVEDRIEELRQLLSGESDGYTEETYSGGGNDEIKSENLLTYDNKEGPQTKSWVSYKQAIAYGERASLPKTVFGSGLAFLINIFRPSKWSEYRRKSKEQYKK